MKKSLFAVVALLLASVCFAQDTTGGEGEKKAQRSVEDYKLSIGILPHYALVNCLRPEIEFKVSAKSWITVAPKFYISNSSDIYDKMEGLGLNIYHKLTINENTESVNFYCAYGAYFTNYQIDKNPYTKYTINKYGPDILFGVQPASGSRFLCDIFLGIGLRYVSSDLSQEELESVTDDTFPMLYPGYTGLLPVFGIKLGVRL